MIRKAIRTYKHSFIVASLLAISTVALSVCFAFSSPLLASAENTESAETLEVIEEVAAQRDQAIERGRSDHRRACCGTSSKVNKTSRLRAI